MEEQSGDIHFTETQRFTQVWVWVIILGISALLTYAMYQQIVLGEPFGSDPSPDLMLTFFWVVIGLGFPIGFYYCRLVTCVKSDSICIRFIPFHRTEQCYSLDQLERAEAVTYRPILDYLGWGIRYGSAGKAYNVRGNRGVKLWFKGGGRPLMLGSQKYEDLARTINRLKKERHE